MRRERPRPRAASGSFFDPNRITTTTATISQCIGCIAPITTSHDQIPRCYRTQPALGGAKALTSVTFYLFVSCELTEREVSRSLQHRLRHRRPAPQRLDHGFRRPVPRSEEHTSEPQSLMR